MTETAPNLPSLSAVPELPITELARSDLGNAERLVREHGDELRYVPGRGWHTWDGTRWRRDVDGELVRRMGLTVRSLYAEALRLDDKERRALTKHALQSEQERRLRAAIILAASDSSIIAPADALDADPLLLNVANGTVHLEVGEILEHDRDHLITKLAPVEFDHDAEAPRWAAFLDQVFAGDAELIDFMQLAVGYSLTGLTSEQVLFVLYGAGANGKTTFLEVLRSLLGEYARQTPAETFLDRRETIPNDVARLTGARVVLAAEVGEGRRLGETLVKRMTGGDTMAARFMRSEWFEFRPVFKPWLATNHRPEIRGTDEAIWRRIKLIPFEVTIPREQRDPELLHKLRAELPGILRWAVEGCQEWRRRGLADAPAVTAATSAYRGQMDVLGAFLDERCRVDDPALSVKAGDLYRAYLGWCRDVGESDQLSQRAFGDRLTDRGYPATRTGDARYRAGIGLRKGDDA